MSTFKQIYPTYESYMVVVDRFLEINCGLGHDHLIDYMWVDAYEDEVIPEDVVDEYFQEFPAWG